jgi:hypothetical protein
MAVTVKHLNAYTSFLFSFSPQTNRRSSEPTFNDGKFSVLVDPWLHGPLIVTASWLAMCGECDIKEIKAPVIYFTMQGSSLHQDVDYYSSGHSLICTP